MRATRENRKMAASRDWKKMRAPAKKKLPGPYAAGVHQICARTRIQRQAHDKPFLRTRQRPRHGVCKRLPKVAEQVCQYGNAEALYQMLLYGVSKASNTAG